MNEYVDDGAVKVIVVKSPEDEKNVLTTNELLTSLKNTQEK